MVRMSRIGQSLRVSKPTETPEARRERRAAEARAAYAADPAKAGLRVKSYRVRNPHKRSAHMAVKHALERGQLVRPVTCSGTLGYAQINCTRDRPGAHHDDYSRPLDVIWLCRTCHRFRHSYLHSIGKDPD